VDHRKSYTKQDIARFIKEEISSGSGLEEYSVDLSHKLDAFALDSVRIVKMAGVLGQKLGLDLEPTLLSEFDSLEQMINQLEIMHKKATKVTIDQCKIDLDVNIVASFTAEPLEEFLYYWLERLLYNPIVQFAPYNQIFQELLNPKGVFYNRSKPANIILLRVEDWFRFETKKLDQDRVKKVLEDFVAILMSSVEERGLNCTIVLCPHSQASVRNLGLADQLDNFDQYLVNVTKNLKQISLIDARNLSGRYLLRKTFDEARDKMGHIPFSQEFFAALGTEISRHIYGKRNNPFKVIVLDCDNTLWGGVCGEDGHLNVQITDHFEQFQRHILACKKKGFLLCLNSKNNESDVWKVFDEHPNMKIHRQDIVASRINWERKSQNILDLAKELELGLDSFIFIDDNLAECEEVQKSLPEVLSIPFPTDETEISKFFNHHWAFDSYQNTAEDKNRTLMYQQNKKRKHLRTQLVNFDDFLSELKVEVDIQFLLSNEIERASQITHRTNQFNATTFRYNEKEIRDFIDSHEHQIVRVSVKDKFGDYGFVGLMIYKLGHSDSLLTCETFLMSCRVLGKKVEHIMIRYLANQALHYGIRKVRLNFQRSDKNKPIENFFISLGRSFTNLDEKESKVEFFAKDIDSLLSTAKNEHDLSVSSEKILSGKSSFDAKNKAQQNEVLNEIALLKGDMDRFIKLDRFSAQLKRPKLSTDYIAPRTTWQKNISSIWQSVLGIDKVGIYDSFYELGGDSLKSALVFAKMWDLGVPDSISLQTIPDPTVAGLSQAIEDVKQGKKPRLLLDQFSLEDEGDLAPDIHNEGYCVDDYKAPIKNVFLTGATGYIGAFIAFELLSQNKEICISALVRSSTQDEGFTRIRENLKRYDLWREGFEHRIKAVLGDLTEPFFGLNQEQFLNLAQKIDTIFHSGAWVNFVYPYQHLKAANVDSVETVLRLAVGDKPRPIQVHFISTLGVIMSYGYPKNVAVYEQDTLAHCEGLLNGYEQSKYVGDKMVWKAFKERGIPANIYRPGMVSGLSDSGVYHKLDEFLPSFLKGCIQLKSWPLVDTTWEIVPIDYVSKAIVHIALNPENLNKAYFSLHPHSRMVSEFIEWHQKFGYQVRALPWDIWKKRTFGSERISLERECSFSIFRFYSRAV
jgi:FkbH-like protein/thioester reductase-like protein